MNIIPEYKAFFTPEKGNDGIYMEVYGKFRTSKAPENTFTDPNLVSSTQFAKIDVSTTGFALGAMVVYKWKSSGALFLEVIGGLGKFLVNNINYSNNFTEDDLGFDDYTPYIGNKLPIDLRIY